MTSLVTKARDDLHAALEAEAVTLGSWRVHKHIPGRLAPPTIFVGAASINSERVGSPGALFAVVTFPVYLVVDGSSRAQAELLDEHLAVVWDACWKVGDPTDARPTSLDAGVRTLSATGDRTLSATVVQVEIPLRAVTLCPPTLEGAVN